MRNKEIGEMVILSPKEWLFPVRRKITGQEPLILHDSFGKSVNVIKSFLTARNSGAGICNNGGHSGGLGMGQKTAWSEFEYSIPHLSSSHLSPFLLMQIQPHLLSLLLLTSLSKTIWRAKINRQRTTGNATSRIFAPTFRFCKRRTDITLSDLFN